LWGPEGQGGGSEKATEEGEEGPEGMPKP